MYYWIIGLFYLMFGCGFGSLIVLVYLVLNAVCVVGLVLFVTV